MYGSSRINSVLLRVGETCEMLPPRAATQKIYTMMPNRQIPIVYVWTVSTYVRVLARGDICFLILCKFCFSHLRTEQKSEEISKRLRIFNRKFRDQDEQQSKLHQTPQQYGGQRAGIHVSEKPRD